MNRRKITAFCIGVILMISMLASYALAGDTGLVQGIKLGIMDEKTIQSAKVTAGVPLTRLQAVELFERILGLTEAVQQEDYTAIDNFSDAKGLTTSKQNMVLFAKMHPELGWSGSDGRFKPTEEITLQQYLKVLLTLLGYEYGMDYTWDGIDEIARAIGFQYYKGMNETLNLEEFMLLSMNALRIENRDGIILYDLVSMGTKLSKDQLIKLAILNEELLNIASLQIEDLTNFHIEFDVKLESLTKDNISVKVDSEKRQVSKVSLDHDGYSADIVVDGLDFDDLVTIQFVNVPTQKTLNDIAFLQSEVFTAKIPSFEETYGLRIECSAAEGVMKSDGETSANIFVQVVNKLNNTVVPINGLAWITATEGTLEQNYLVLKNGQAIFSYTAGFHTVVTDAKVRVELFNIPLNQEYEGVTGELMLSLNPNVDPEADSFAVPIAAYTNESNEVCVAFSMSVDAEEVKEMMIKTEHNLMNETWAEFVSSGDATVLIDRQQVKILDMIQETDNVLRFVLSDDISLQDNMKHAFSLNANIEPIILTDFQNMVFYLNDMTVPDVLTVSAINNRNIDIAFSEGLCHLLVEGSRNYYRNSPTESGINKHFTLDGRGLYIINDSLSGASQAEKNYAVSNNLILVKSLVRGQYDTVTGVDYRNHVYIELESGEQLTIGDHKITIEGIGDEAGNTDNKNIMPKTEVKFSVITDVQAPIVSIKTLSPYKWLVSFDEKVSCTEKDWLTIWPGNAIAEPLQEDVHYVVKDISPNQSAPSEYLIEFAQNWVSSYDKTESNSNYWDKGLNPLRVQFIGKNIADNWGNKLADQTLLVTLSKDLVSPFIQTVEPFNNYQIRLTFNEPVDIDTLGAQFSLLNGTKTVKGTVKKNSMNEMATSFVINTESPLEFGEWLLSCSKIVDETGNIVSSNPIGIIIK